MGMAWNMLKPLCPGPKIAGIYGCSSPKCGRYQNVSNGLSKLRNYPQKWMAGPPWVLKKLTHPKISRSWHVSPVETKEKPRPLSVAWCDQVVYIPCRIFFHISRESREARNHQKPFQWEYGQKKNVPKFMSILHSRSRIPESFHQSAAAWCPNSTIQKSIDKMTSSMPSYVQDVLATSMFDYRFG